MKLSNETWYAIKNKLPLSWESEEGIITPNLEVYLPFYANPDIFFIIGSNCQLLNNIDNMDYLLVFDISPPKYNFDRCDIISYNNFVNTLQSICSDIPSTIGEYYVAN